MCECQETGWLQKIYHCLIRFRVSYCYYPSPPSSAQGPRWYISIYMTHATCTQAQTHTCMNMHIAAPYISVSMTGSVCVSPIIWPLDSNGWERRVGFPCGLNTTAFITHNRSTVLAPPFTGEMEEGRKTGICKNARSIVCQEFSVSLCTLSTTYVLINLFKSHAFMLHCIQF